MKRKGKSLKEGRDHCRLTKICRKQTLKERNFESEKRQKAINNINFDQMNKRKSTVQIW